MQATVLIADDDEGIRETLRMILDEAGYTVVEVASGEAALAALRTGMPPAVVVLDYLMPGLSGQAVLSAVAEDDTLARRHAYLLLTGLSRSFPPEVINPRGNLTVKTLEKPFDIDPLLQLIAELARTLDGRGSAPKQIGSGPL
jgi:DNA-binding NtrC family response regulator